MLTMDFAHQVQSIHDESAEEYLFLQINLLHNM